MTCRGPVWEFADQVHIGRARSSEAHVRNLVFLIPSRRPLRHTLHLTFSRLRQPHSAQPDVRLLRLELDKFLHAPSTPRRSAPSCWPAPPSQASLAFSPTGSS